MGEALRISLSKSYCIPKSHKNSCLRRFGPAGSCFFYIVTWASVFTYSTDCMICA